MREHNRHRTVAGIAVNLLLREFSISTSRVDFHEYSDATPVINTLSCPRIFRACAVSVYQALFYEGLGTRLGREGERAREKEILCNPYSSTCTNRIVTTTKRL